MSIVKKSVSPAFIAANRANSRRSTGPRSEEGKRRTARNAGRYFVFSQITPSRMVGIGEDPEEFERLRQSLRSAVGPRDGFEEMLVEAMAVNRWRLARLRRGEMGILWRGRMSLESARFQVLKREASTDNITVQAFGFAGLPDSPHKFIQLHDLLVSLRSKVEREGFTPEGLELLKTIYGETPDVPGFGLVAKFQAQMPPGEAKPDDEDDQEETEPRAEDEERAGDEGEETGPPTEDDEQAESERENEEGAREQPCSGPEQPPFRPLLAKEGKQGRSATDGTPQVIPHFTGEEAGARAEARRSFLDSLNREIETFSQLGKAHALALIAPLPEPLMDTGLIPSKDDMDRIVCYETMLQREFERIQKQLLDWRHSNLLLAASPPVGPRG